MADGKISSIDAFDAQGLNALYLWITSWLRSETKSVLGGGSGITEITSVDTSVTVTDPGGPTTDLKANVMAPISVLTQAGVVTTAAPVISTVLGSPIVLLPAAGSPPSAFYGSYVQIAEHGETPTPNADVEAFVWRATVGASGACYFNNSIFTSGDGGQVYGTNMQLIGGESATVSLENTAATGGDFAAVTGRQETLVTGDSGSVTTDLVTATGGTDATVTGLQYTLHGAGTGDVTNTLLTRSVDGQSRALILDATSTGSGVPYALLVANGYVDLGLPTSDPSLAGAAWNQNGLVVLSGFTGVTLADMSGAFTYLRVQTGVPSTYDRPLVYDNTAVTGGLWAWDGSAYQKVGPL